MVGRGREQELSNFYAQGGEAWQWLVAVDLDKDAPPQKVAAADRVLQEEVRRFVVAEHPVSHFVAVDE